MELTINNWANELGEVGLMQEILNNLSVFVSQLNLFDSLIILLLLVFAIMGVKRGFALMLIRFVWYLFGLIIASVCYTDLANSGTIGWLGGDDNLNAFLLILGLFFIFKLIIYKILEKIAALHGPCPVNRFLATTVGILIAAGMSYMLAENISQIEVFYKLVKDENIRLIGVFTLVMSIVLITSFVLIKMLNIKVGIDRPCPLLLALRPLDSILNAKNINSKANHFFGLFFGLFFGFLVVILLHIILVNILSIQIDSYFVTYFEDIASNTQSVLSQYLTFIEKR